VLVLLRNPHLVIALKHGVCCLVNDGFYTVKSFFAWRVIMAALTSLSYSSPSRSEPPLPSSSSSISSSLSSASASNSSSFLRPPSSLPYVHTSPVSSLSFLVSPTNVGPVPHSPLPDHNINIDDIALHYPHHPLHNQLSPSPHETREIEIISPNTGNTEMVMVIGRTYNNNNYMSRSGNGETKEEEKPPLYLRMDTPAIIPIRPTAVGDGAAAIVPLETIDEASLLALRSEIADLRACLSADSSQQPCMCVCSATFPVLCCLVTPI
jgi:hypothetical protein